jgi:K+-sensing histidine kinase KdpD
MSHGGSVYFIMSAFSCLIAYNRFYILRRNIAHDIVIDEAHERLITQNEKINDQRYVIEDVNRKLKTLNDYRHNTMNIMLHDFRSFTGSIQMSLDLLKHKSENFTAEQKEIINYISTGNDKLSYLSEKLAASADRDEANVEFNYEYFDINPEIEKSVMGMFDAAQLKDINLQLHLSASVIMVYLDKMFLEQVLFKLLTNAIKYAEKESIITIHSNHISDKCIIEVINFGKELGSEKLNDLFNKLKPYKSLRESIASDADLGFSVAKKLTESMNGTLTYTSDEKKGNYYKIEFNSTH